MKELADAAAGYDADPDVGAIVITGSGDKAFAAGADIKTMADKSSTRTIFLPHAPGGMADIFQQVQQAVMVGGQVKS